MAKIDVMFAAGGTGGHIYPALAIAQELQIKHQKSVAWMGSINGLEQSIVPNAGIKAYWINAQRFRGKSRAHKLALPFSLGRSFSQALVILLRHRPALLVSMGGFVSVPAALAAKCLGIPIVLHEQNAIAGMANSLISRISKHNLSAYQNPFKHRARVHCIGNPIRAALQNAPQSPVKKSSSTMHCLVLGGSQGARMLNQVIPQAWALVERGLDYQIWHQCGAQHLEATKAAYQKYGIKAKVSAYIEDMNQAYDWADFIISRSGAMSVSEISYKAKAALFIPFPYAVDNHQTFNAKRLMDQGGALMMEEKDLNPKNLCQTLTDLIKNPKKRIALANAAESCAQKDANSQFINYCLSKP